MTAPVLPYPPIAVTVDNPQLNKISVEWQNWYQQVFNILNAATQSGPTANRPTKGLWLGRTYFNTTTGNLDVIVAVSSTSTTWKSATLL